MNMPMPSGLAAMLQGFDCWVDDSRPSSEVAQKALTSLQRAAMQMRTGREPIASIPFLIRTERHGPLQAGGVSIPMLPQRQLLF